MTGILEYPTGSSAAANVRDRILQSILYLGDPGDPRLPSERQLAGMLGVERGTVRAALHELGAMGVVTNRRGRYGGTSWIQVSPLVLTSQPANDGVHGRARVDLAMIQELAWNFMQSGPGAIDYALVVGAEDALASGIGEFWADARLNGAMWTAAGGSVLALAASTAHMVLVRGQPDDTSHHTDHRAMLRLSLQAARGKLTARGVAVSASQYVRILAA